MRGMGEELLGVDGEPIGMGAGGCRGEASGCGVTSAEREGYGAFFVGTRRLRPADATEEVELNGASAGGQEEVEWGGWRGMGGETCGLREYSF
jgi:hypothetical protein